MITNHNERLNSRVEARLRPTFSILESKRGFDLRRVDFIKSIRLRPTKRAADGFLPLGVALVALVGGQLGFEFAVEGPVAGDVAEVYPIADRKTGQIRRAKGSGFGDDGSANRGVEDI